MIQCDQEKTPVIKMRMPIPGLTLTHRLRPWLNQQVTTRQQPQSSGKWKREKKIEKYSVMTLR